MLSEAALVFLFLSYLRHCDNPLLQFCQFIAHFLFYTTLLLKYSFYQRLANLITFGFLRKKLCFLTLLPVNWYRLFLVLHCMVNGSVFSQSQIYVALLRRNAFAAVLFFFFIWPVKFTMDRWYSWRHPCPVFRKQLRCQLFLFLLIVYLLFYLLFESDILDLVFVLVLVFF